MRSLVVLSVFLFSGLSLANDWQQQDFSVEASLTQNSTKYYQTRVNQSALHGRAQTLQLFDGFALKGKLGLTYDNFSGLDGDQEQQSEFSYNGSLASRLFLSPVSNVDISASYSNRYQILSVDEARYQSSDSPVVNSQQRVIVTSWQLGSVAQLRSLNLSVRHREDEKTSAVSNRLFKSEQSNDFSARFTNRVSEDTNLVINLGHSQYDLGFQSGTKQPDITDALVGFITDYFGNSSLEILVGISKRSETDRQASSDVFSWQLINVLSLSESSALTLSTKRQLTSSPNPVFLDAQLSDLEIDFGWRFLDNWSFKALAQVTNLEFGDGSNADMSAVKTELGWRINEYLRVGSFIKYEDFDGEQTRFIHSGLNAGINLSWEFY